MENILTRNYDYSALFLCVLDSSSRGGGVRGSFKFEMAWQLDEGCTGVMKNVWQDGRVVGLLSCLHLCGERLLKWGGNHFHKFDEEIKHLRKTQYRLRGLQDSASLAEFQRIEDQLVRLEA